MVAGFMMVKYYNPAKPFYSNLHYHLLMKSVVGILAVALLLLGGCSEGITGKAVTSGSSEKAIILKPAIRAANIICEDSDGGQNREKKGKLYVNVAGRTITETVVCEDSRSVREYLCQPNGYTSTILECEKGCLAGKCI